VNEALVPVVLAALLSGCTASRVFVAGSCDYADYRRVRLGETLEDRLAAAWDYLDARPDGTYADVVERWFDRAEPVFYEVKRGSAAGLEAYLAALPRGPHADEALARLGDLRDARRRSEVEGAALSEKTGQRLDLEREQRAAAADLLLSWVLAFADEKVWNTPFARVPGDLLSRWEVSLPAPVCDVHPETAGWHRCAKAPSQAYRVAGMKGGVRVDRDAALLVSIDLDPAWTFRTVVMSGPAVLVRTHEARGGKELDDDAAGLDAARAFATRLTEALFARELACNGGTDEAGKTELVCNQLRIVVLPGRGGDDVVTIVRVDAPGPADAPE
jgi:hypothetical protein